MKLPNCRINFVSACRKPKCEWVTIAHWSHLFIVRFLSNIQFGWHLTIYRARTLTISTHLMLYFVRHFETKIYILATMLSRYLQCEHRSLISNRKQPEIAKVFFFLVDSGENQNPKILQWRTKVNRCTECHWRRNLFGTRRMAAKFLASGESCMTAQQISLEPFVITSLLSTYGFLNHFETLAASDDK